MRAAEIGKSEATHLSGPVLIIKNRGLAQCVEEDQMHRAASPGGTESF